MFKHPKLIPPNNEKQILLHSCCAPCSGQIMEALLNSNIKYTIFFYNPNIQPLKEYEIRKNENKLFAEKLNIPFVDADYELDKWYNRTKSMEFEPERGQRCTNCFEMRFEKTALYALKHSFKVFTSSMGISRWKDITQVNTAGKKIAQNYHDLSYWDYNWRKKGGSQRMLDIAKQEHFYQQEYCGCVYSLREVNQRRKIQGRNFIQMGEKHYGDK
ncbi:MAG: epoxyqueuosine reductase QueH [Thiomargarita sp.]|nr:epoxyqueuosine reductase QueH [Thiomargarita sp.]